MCAGPVDTLYYDNRRQTPNCFKGHAHVRARQPEGNRRQRLQGPCREREPEPGAEGDGGVVVQEGEMRANSVLDSYQSKGCFK